MNRETAQKAIIQVGDGRGFITEAGRRYVITAAHCLPGMVEGKLPPTHPGSYMQERTYHKLLGPLGEKPKVWAECLFVDPIADVAVLGTPDGQVFYKEAEAYDFLTEPGPALQIADCPSPTRGWLLSLEGKWNKCRVHYHSSPLGARHRVLWIDEAPAGIHGRMSGSPVLNDAGQAIGLMNIGDAAFTEGGPNPHLADCLPPWLLQWRAPAGAAQSPGMSSPQRSRRPS